MVLGYFSTLTNTGPIDATIAASFENNLSWHNYPIYLIFK